MTSLATAVIGRTYREHGARIHAALVRRFSDLDLAEDAVHEAMVAALEQWGDSIPNDPAAWLVRTAYHKAVDRIRRSQVARDKQGDVVDIAEASSEGIPDNDLFQHDDALRLIFLCCHPALPFESQVALTLRTVSCLTTAEIARAFMVPEMTMAQRIVRAKAKIRDARIPFRTPDESEIDERIDAVLSVVYLVFNEGYAVTAGERLVRDDLCTEALRLVRVLVDLAPSSGPCAGLRALLLLTDARRAARLDTNGDVVLLEDQDRSLWNREQTERGLSEVERAITLGPPRHPYTLQSAIAAVHARAATASDTNWSEIASLYELLLHAAPSPIVELNHAVAVAMAQGLEAGLSLLDALSVRGELDGEHLFHAARGDLCHRAGLRDEARAAYERAAALVTNEPERRFIEKRRREIG